MLLNKAHHAVMMRTPTVLLIEPKMSSLNDRRQAFHWQNEQSQATVLTHTTLAMLRNPAPGACRSWDLFWTSLQTYIAGGLGPYIIIIENSMDKRAANDLRVSHERETWGLLRDKVTPS